MTSRPRLAEIARRLRARGDAINGAVWFVSEAERGYPPLALESSTASMAARAACLGSTPPEVAAALFAPIEPTNLERRLREAWSVTTPAEVLAAREQAVVRWLDAALGGVPDGLDSTLATLERALEAASPAAHPVFAGLRALPRPSHPLARLQRAGEMVRERRGDSHRNAWSAAGLSAVELCVFTDAWRGAPIGAVTCGAMGWPRDLADATADELRSRGWLDGGTITDAGRDVREAVEAATDAGDVGLVDALGDDADAVIAALSPIARAIVTAGADSQMLQRRDGR